MLWSICVGVLILIIFLVIIVLKFTPLNGILFNNKEMRKSVTVMQRQVAALQDTVTVRNKQLQDIKRIIVAGKDTTLSIRPVSRKHTVSGNKKASESSAGIQTASKIKLEELPSNAAKVAALFKNAPDFPAFYPIKGVLTEGFNIEDGHYGLDIAADAGTPFRAIADGVIISEVWTFNYGYVIVIQHADGILTIYKHARTLSKAIGQTVKEGDILGTIGKVGILTTGPHLHIEIWRDGIPQNPEQYLMGTK
jgi:murein DD-endopeptidase MepM/ murein hydrolase activator NlpD